jgi:hypothetical protein
MKKIENSGISETMLRFAKIHLNIEEIIAGGRIIR